MRGLFYGDRGQFIAECIGILANVAYVAPGATLALFLIGKTVGNRTDAEDEVAGLDEPEMGMQGYADDKGHTAAPPEPVSVAPRASGGVILVTEK